MQERLCTKPKSFWEFVRSKRGVSSIPEEIHLGETKATDDQVASLFASRFSSVYKDAFELSNQVDVIYNDFSEVFDSIDHRALHYVLDRLGVGEPLLS
ncbi:Hypothetical protein CINCED_3A004497 [Cinara cedri]|uniref:Reverse transcriptase domain n=1 Tax=Cinara cedri TaxID=506608 RepID=A0A5E4MKF7_9HEMI|nr:Hypothetical protein CINCED_3A004497 [Cinara cedri]